MLSKTHLLTQRLGGPKKQLNDLPENMQTKGKDKETSLQRERERERIGGGVREREKEKVVEREIWKDSVRRKESNGVGERVIEKQTDRQINRSIGSLSSFFSTLNNQEHLLLFGSEMGPNSIHWKIQSTIIWERKHP